MNILKRWLMAACLCAFPAVEAFAEYTTFEIDNNIGFFAFIYASCGSGGPFSRVYPLINSHLTCNGTDLYISKRSNGEDAEGFSFQYEDNAKQRHLITVGITAAEFGTSGGTVVVMTPPVLTFEHACA